MALNRLFVLGMLFFGLLLVGLGLMRGELLVLALPLGAYWLAGLWLSPVELSLSVRRSLSARRLTAGGTVDVLLELENHSSGIDQVCLRDVLPAGLEVIDGEPGQLARLGSGEKLAVAYTLRVPRGVYTFEPVEVRAGDRFGLADSVLHLPAEGRISALPQAIRIRGVPLHPYQTKGYHGIIPARRGGAGVTFYGVRDYQPGDALRQVNWRLGARYPDALYSNEFQVDATADVSLLLDGRGEMYASIGEASLLDYVIQATASLAQSFLDEGNRVSLLAFGYMLDWTRPGYGKLQAERIFHALAALRLGNTQMEIPEALVANYARPGSEVVVISPLAHRDIRAILRLRARRYSLLVVSPDPTSFEFPRLAHNATRDLAVRIARLERQRLLRPLRQAGVLTLDWNVGQPLDLALKIFQRSLLTGVPPGGGMA